MTELANQIFSRLQNTLGDPQTFVPLHEPVFRGNENKYVQECIDTGWVSSVGSFVDRFEKDLARTTGHKYAIATVNGTAALHICLLLAGVREGDEVLSPSLTFVATANAIRYAHAEPHFIDVNEESLGVCARKLRAHLEEVASVADGVCINKITGRPIRALVPMHTFGYPTDMPALLQVCDEFKIELVEDVAESLGSYINDVHTGRFGSLAAMSFNGNKVVTAGGGGAILTDDEDLAIKAKHLTTTAKVPHKWEFVHDQTGYNYRMPNLNAALICAQLEQLSEILTAKQEIHERYRSAFQDLDGAFIFEGKKTYSANHWLNALVLDVADRATHQSLLEQTNTHNIMTRPIWTPMHHLPMYRNCPKANLGCTDELAVRIINVPSGVKVHSCMGLS